MRAACPQASDSRDVRSTTMTCFRHVCLQVRSDLAIAFWTENVLPSPRPAILALCLATTACIVAQPVAYPTSDTASPALALPLQQAQAASVRFATDCPLSMPSTYDHAVQLRPPGDPPAPGSPMLIRVGMANISGGTFVSWVQMTSRST